MGRKLSPDSAFVTAISSGPRGANTSDFEGGRLLNGREVPQDLELL